MANANKTKLQIECRSVSSAEYQFREFDSLVYVYVMCKYQYPISIHKYITLNRKPIAQSIYIYNECLSGVDTARTQTQPIMII